MINFLIFAGAAAVYMSNGSAANADWFAVQTPQLTKAISLPGSQLPDMRNLPCKQVSYITNNSAVQDCVGSTTFGVLSAQGKGLYVDDQTAVPVLLNGGNAISFLPAPGTFSTLAINYATGTIWNYIGFYSDLRREDLADKQVSTGFLQFQRQFWVPRGPDYYLTGSTGSKLLLNSQAMAFSPNGRWLVVDSPNALLRIDLNDPARPIVAFAPSLEQPGSNGLANAQLAVTDDGRYVAVSVRSLPFGVDPNLTIYDVSACTGLPNFAGCRSRDIWKGVHGVAQSMVDPGRAGNLRFIDNENLSFNDVFNQAGSSYDAATFVVTAPGGSLHGWGLLGMGDSYISGEGAFFYSKNTDTDNNHCHESLTSYPYLLGSENFSTYESVACSGAVTNDIRIQNKGYKGQVKDNLTMGQRDVTGILQQFAPGYLTQNQFVSTYKPEVILLSIGGNDMGFDSIVKNCVAHFQLVNPFDATGFENTCYASYEDRAELMQSIDKKFNTLVQTYQDIKAASPASRIYVVGYPQIVEPHGNCALNVRLDDFETQFATDTIAYIDSVIKRAADKAGVFYVDASHAFDGHKLCDAHADAVNGLAFGDDEYGIIGHESYHPTILGHQLLARAVDVATKHLTAPMPTAQNDAPAPKISGNEDMLLSAPVGKTGRQMYAATRVTGTVPALLERGSTALINLTGLLSNFASNSLVRIAIHSDSQDAGTVHTDANGDITDGQLTVPQTIEPGYHTLDLYGKDWAGNNVDIQQAVYITNSPDDYDGDSVPNTQDACLYITNSGADYDQDGIDDACDPAITSPPVIVEPDDSDSHQVVSGQNNASGDGPDAIPGSNEDGEQSSDNGLPQVTVNVPPTSTPIAEQQLQPARAAVDSNDEVVAATAVQASTIMQPAGDQNTKQEPVVLGSAVAVTSRPTHAKEVAVDGISTLWWGFLASAGTLSLLALIYLWLCRREV